MSQPDNIEYLKLDSQRGSCSISGGGDFQTGRAKGKNDRLLRRLAAWKSLA